MVVSLPSSAVSPVNFWVQGGSAYSSAAEVRGMFSDRLSMGTGDLDCSLIDRNPPSDPMAQA